MRCRDDAITIRLTSEAPLVIIPILLYNRQKEIPSFSDSLVYRGVAVENKKRASS